MSFWKKVFNRCSRTEDTVICDDKGITRKMPNGTVESLQWADLLEVGILTTADGPYKEDLFWMLLGGDGRGCCIPQGVRGASELPIRLQQLPYYDNEMVIKAMGSTTEAKFLCWKRRA